MPEITISGHISNGPTTGSITYFVVDRAGDAIVGNITLPNASTVANAFSLEVKIPEYSDSIDVGLLDGDGKFVSAGFTIEGGKRPTGAVGPRG